MSAGKTIYKGKEGKLQTVLFIEKENAVDEYLVSYNASGNVVDCIRIASIRHMAVTAVRGLLKGALSNLPPIHLVKIPNRQHGLAIE